MRKRQPRLRVGVPVLAAGITMVAVAVVGSAPLIQGGQPAPCFPETCPQLGIFTIVGVVGFFVVLWGVLETGAGFLIQKGYIQYNSGPLKPPEIGQGQEDEKILSIAREIADQIRPKRWRAINNVAWNESQAWYWSWTTRRRRGKPAMLQLPYSLRGKLESEDWRLLIRYYFLQKADPRLMLWFLALILPFIAIPVLLTFVVPSLLVRQAIGGFAGVSLLILIFPWAKWLILKQDRKIAHVIGGSPLVELFERVDRLQIPDIENAKKRRGLIAWLWPMPNMTERIQNLRT